MHNEYFKNLLEIENLHKEIANQTTGDEAPLDDENEPSDRDLEEIENDNGRDSDQE